MNIVRNIKEGISVDSVSEMLRFSLHNHQLGFHHITLLFYFICMIVNC